MAETVAQAIKDVQKSLDMLDKKLMMDEQNWKELGNVITQTMQNGKVSLDDFYKEVANRTKSATNGMKLRLIVEANREDIQKNIDKIKAALKDSKQSVNIDGSIIKGTNAMKAALQNYRNELKLMPKSTAEAFDYIYNLLNKVNNGTKKSNHGTDWSIQRSKVMKREGAVIEEINNLYKERERIEASLQKRKEGSSGWVKDKKAIEEINRSIERQDELLARIRNEKQSGGVLTGLSKETKQLIQESRDLARENERLAKVRQNDAQWQEQQRKNTEAQFVANGKAIEQQRKLADQIDQIARKRDSLSKSPDVDWSKLHNLYSAQIKELQQQRLQIERQFKGSLKAGDDAFLLTRSSRDYQNNIKESEKKEREFRKAVAEQVTYQRQLNTLRKEYNTLNAKKGRTNEENAILEKTKNKIREIIGLSKQLNNEQRGSHILAKQITEYDRLRQKIRETNKAKKELTKTGYELGNLIPVIQRIGSALGVAFSVQGLVQFGKKLVETRGIFELQQVSLRSILQNKELADEIWGKTMQAALQSPFTAMQLTKYTKQLAAYRIETDKLFDTTKRLADVSAGLGVDMQRLILAYGQVKAANYLRSSEIRQFTEAGVNILGELSKYLSDVKGEFISTAQVMDMVQKRMVTFGAVEEVFKRLTDQGGIFYEMQYVQSQTVKGQLNKLHDAYDQMLNNIGKANQGAIRNMVGLLNNIVKNWREWKTVLDAIVWPLLISSVYKFSRGLTTAAASAAIASGRVNGLTKAGAKLQLMLNGLKLSTMAWMAGLVAVTAAIAALINHTKAVKATQQAIYEQNAGLFEQRNQLEKYKKTLEENNDAIKNNSGSEEELKNKRAENHSILTKLKNDYPQLAEGMEQMTDGTIKLTDALDRYNKALEDQMTINYLLSQQSGGWLSDTVKDNLQAWETDMSQIKGELIAMQQAATVGMSRMFTEKKTDEPLYKLLEQIKNIDLSDIIKAREEYEKLYNQIYALGEYKGSPTGIGAGAYILPEYAKELKRIEKFLHDEPTALEDFNNKTLPTIRRIFEDNIRSFSDYSKEISEKYDKSIVAFIAKNGKSINEGIKNGNKDVVKAIRTSLQTAGIGLTEESRNLYNKIINEQIKFEAFQEIWAKQTDKSLKNRLKVTAQFLKDYQEIDFFAAPSTSDSMTPLEDKEGKAKREVEKMISLLKEMHSEYDKLSKSAYGYAKSNEKVRKSFEDAFKEVFKVRGGTGTYIDYDKVDITSKKALADSLQMLYDELARTQTFSKFGKAFEQELLKAIATANSEVDLEVSVRVREDFKREIEEMFGNYELTLELNKLNIPQSVLNEMFDIDSTSLADIRERLNDWYEKMGADLNETFFKEYQGYLKKIDDEERKLQRQRLKDYSKYLEYQLSERAKAEMEYINKLAIVQSEKAFTPTQKKQIADGLKKEYEEAMGKLDWEDFKGSEFYVGMFEDLDKQGSASLDVMRNALIDLRKNAKNLSPRALKELVKDLEKIDEIERSRKPPFQRMREEAEKLNKALDGRDIREIFSKLATEQDSQRALQDELKLTEEVIGAKTKEAKVNEVFEKQGKQDIKKIEKEKKLLEKALKYRVENKRLEYVDPVGFRQDTADINALKARIKEAEEYIEAYKTYQEVQKLISSKKYAKYQGMSLEELLGEKSDLKDNLKLTDEQIQQLQLLIDTWDRYQKAILDSYDEVAKYIQLINGAISSTFPMLQNYGYATDELSKQWQSMANALATSGVNITNALKDFNSSKNKWTESTSNIAKSADWITMIIKVVLELINIIGEAGLFDSARIDNEIREHQEKIDKLTMAYNRLERQIERTWDTVSYMQSYDDMVANLQQQIEQTEAQLAAARDRKNKDQSEINGYINAIADLKNQLEDLDESATEMFGGIVDYRSAAEGFVDAWKQAFLETGNGLDGLQEHFNEFLQDWFVKQAVMSGAASLLEPVFNEINNAVNPDREGGASVTISELERIFEVFGTQRELLDDYLTKMAGMYRMSDSGSLSGLAAGIQGMTEEQANVLEAYWNSVRMYTANIDMNVSRIAEMLGVGGPNSNPMLTHLQTIASNTAFIPQIYSLLNGSTKNMGNGRGFVTYQL